MKSKKEKRKDKEICKDFYNKCQNYHRNLSKIEANRLKYDEIMNDMYGITIWLKRRMSFYWRELHYCTTQ